MQLRAQTAELSQVGNNSRPTIVFDGDDTLWSTMPIYARAKQRFFDFMGQLGFSRELAETKFEQRDLQNVAKLGFSRDRFRISMLETYRELAQGADEIPEKDSEYKIERIGNSVFEQPARRMPHADRVLAALRPAFHLILLTKGDPKIQAERLAASRLAEYFDSVLIVPSKDAETFRQLIEQQSVIAEHTWSVGNSIKSDINPALAAGMNAVWIPRRTWAFEDEPPLDRRRIVRANSLRHLPHVLQMRATAINHQ